MYVANYGDTVANYGSVCINMKLKMTLFGTPSSKLSKPDRHRG